MCVWWEAQKNSLPCSQGWGEGADRGGVLYIDSQPPFMHEETKTETDSSYTPRKWLYLCCRISFVKRGAPWGGWVVEAGPG